MEQRGKTQIELDSETFDIIHELVLRGLRQTDVTDREYGEAYDEFVDAANGPIRIGDQPDRVKEVWENVFESAPDGKEEYLEELEEADPGDVLILDEVGKLSDEERHAFKKFFSSGRKQ